MIIKKRKFKAEALFQIILLVVAIFAFSYLLGNSLEIVSAADDPVCSVTCVDDSNCGSCCQGDIYYEQGGACTVYLDGSGSVCEYLPSQGILKEGYCGYTTSNAQGGNGGNNNLLDTAKNTVIYVGQQVISDIVREKLNLKKLKPIANIPTENGAATAKLTKVINNIPEGLEGLTRELELMQQSLSEGFGSLNDADKAYLEGRGVDLAQLRDSSPNLIERTWDKIVNLFTEGKPDLVAGDHWWGLEAQKLSQALAWAGAIYLGLKGLSLLAGALGDDALSDALNQAAQWGSLAYIGVYGLGAILEGIGAAGSTIAGWGAALMTPVAGWIAAGIAVIWTLFSYRSKNQQVITFQCMPWQAPTGGDDCEECNDQGLISCTEYQCKTLGQACVFVDEMCIASQDDGMYPRISPWQDALLNQDYSYAVPNTVSNLQQGAYIIYSLSGDGCIPAFTPLSFGITLDEYARCKISPTRSDSYETMPNIFFGGEDGTRIGSFDINHSYQLAIPGISALQGNNISLPNGGEYELYVRCTDYNGNANPTEYVFMFCIDQGQDYTAPVIKSTNPLNGAPVTYNTESIETTFYVNEPAECRWSHTNQDYDSMPNTMTCATNVLEMNAYMNYPCTTTLTGIHNNMQNTFYIRCRDQPQLIGTPEESQRNTNTQSYEYILIGTEPLILNWVTPNNTVVRGPSSSIQVMIEAETSAGYNNGISTCYFSETGEDGTYVQFQYPGGEPSYQHSQELWLEEGSYEFYIRCIDLGGNMDSAIINFDVEVDVLAPTISRAYYDEGYLKIVTDERAECVYETAASIGCNYNIDEAGNAMHTNDNLEHYTTWNNNMDYYIKCIDENGIYPPYNECSIVVRPVDIL